MFVAENRKSIGHKFVFFLFGLQTKLLNRLFSLESFNLILIPINSKNLYLFGSNKKATNQEEIISLPMFIRESIKLISITINSKTYLFSVK